MAPRDAHHLAIIVLAAGRGARFGAPKQLAELQGIPLLAHTLTHLERFIGLQTDSLAPRQASSAPSLAPLLLVVLGAHAENIRRQLPLGFAQVIDCQNWLNGMSESIKAALDHLPESITDILITTADMPLVDANDYQKLWQTAQNHPGCVISAGQAQHHAASLTAAEPLQSGPLLPCVPAIFPAQWLPQLRQMTGDKGARDLLRSANPGQRILVAMPACAWDIDTPEDLQRVARYMASANQQRGDPVA
jgi:molybdenum cofactor cytidylyltransferase